MCRFMDNVNTKITCPRFIALLFLLVLSFIFVSTGNAYYGLSGPASSSGLYGGFGLYGLAGGFYGLGLYGIGSLYGGLNGLYGLNSLYDLSRLYGIGSFLGLKGLNGVNNLSGLCSLYGLSGPYGPGNLGFYGGISSLGGLAGLRSIYGPNGTPGLCGLSSLYGLNAVNLSGFGSPRLGFPGNLMTIDLKNTLFAAEQAGAWTGTWNLGFLFGTMIMNLQETITGSLSGTAQLIGNLTFGGIFNVYGSSEPTFISLTGQDPTLTYAVTIQGTLTTPSTMEGFYSIYKIGATVPKETGTFNLELLV